MIRTFCVVFVLLASVALAADADPVLKQYQDALEQLRNKPAAAGPLLSLLPPSNPPTAEQRAALNGLVSFVDGAASKAPKDFALQHNLYVALWQRYLLLGAVGDARRARKQALVAKDLAEAESTDRAQCAYEHALTGLGLQPGHVAAVLGASPVDANIAAFKSAMRATVNKGPYVPRASLHLGELYLQKGEAKDAERYLRAALALDKRGRRGYISNRAYDALGRLKLSANDVDAAATMLTAAGDVQIDADLKAQGFAIALAAKLNEKERHRVVSDYLKAAHAMAKKGDGRIQPELVYHLALSYGKTNKNGPALVHWQEYFGMHDPDATRRASARKIARKIAIGTDG
jgi:tetratricopeptide (TPR) repeat protein